VLVFLEPSIRMDASSLLNRKRNQTLYTWISNKSAEKQEQVDEKSNLVYIHRIQGCSPYFQSGKAMECCTSNGSDYTLDEAALLALEAVLQYGATNNLGPTKCSRINYLWFFTVATGYNWISGNSPISGTKDGWSWIPQFSFTLEQDIFLFMNHLLVDIMPIFVPGYDTSALLENERTALNLTAQEQAEQVARVQAAGNYAGWFATWQLWYTNRQADGSVAAAAYIPTTTPDLPNGLTTLTVWDTTQNPATFTDSTKWTPLQLTNGGARRNYYTWKWHDVTTTCLTPADNAAIVAAADAHYPTNRTADIAALLAITNTLNVREDLKMLAEFWAAGPYTISPPGMFIWFWKEYMAATKTAHTQGFGTFFYSGLDLAIHLFEAGRMVWEVKKNRMQARPIQEVRNLFRSTPVTQYDGTITTGQFWMPYQAANFVTPPFADFPSGHSAFSQSFAIVMSEWFGAMIPSITTTRTDQKMLSASLPATATQTFGQFTFAPGSSEVQPGLVPSAPITVGADWVTWQDMANSAGLSRQYGGIHANSAHVGSQALANALHTAINTNWRILK
jgi:hypothetical protein